MGTLRALADSGHTVVCTIHQPRGSIFKMFDDLMLVSAGQLLYSGPANAAVDSFLVGAQMFHAALR
jgi:ABC-type multidrug transport system ATPase subunit